MLRVLKTGINLDLLGDVDAPFPDVMKQAMQFITSCYGQPHCDSMSEARIRVCTVITGKPGTTNAPKLCSLPSTTEAFRCSCSSLNPRRTSRCGCNNAKLACRFFVRVKRPQNVITKTQKLLPRTTKKKMMMMQKTVLVNRNILSN